MSDLLEELIAARLAEVRRRAAARAPRTPGLVARIVKRPRALAPEEKAERARTEMARLKARLNRSTS